MCNISNVKISNSLTKEEVNKTNLKLFIPHSVITSGLQKVQEIHSSQAPDKYFSCFHIEFPQTMFTCDACWEANPTSPLVDTCENITLPQTSFAGGN